MINKKLTAGLLIAGLLALSLTACGEKNNTTSGETTPAAASGNETVPGTDDGTGTDTGTINSDGTYVTKEKTVYIPNTSGILVTSDIFSNRDLTNVPDLTDAVSVTVSDSQTYDISSEGVYVFSGTAKNYTIKVNAGKEAKVQLVLDGVNITNDNAPAVYVKKVDKCFVTTSDGSSNSLTVGGSFTSDGDENTDAVIYSKSDLVLNGLGTLDIISSDNGITGKDDLKITGGTINVSSESDAIEANDSIIIAGGALTLSSKKDGLHCKNDKDDSLGYVFIAGGSFDINVTDDAIQANSALQIDGGSFKLKADEGFEATAIQINGGNITINASNDGINASDKSTSFDCGIEINDGTLTIVMPEGDTDAIDANGNVTINGGTVDLTAPVSAFDYTGTASFNGGKLIINGEEVTEIPAPIAAAK